MLRNFTGPNEGVQTELRSVPVSGGDPTVLLESSPSVGAIDALGLRPQEILLGTGSSGASLPTTVHSLPEDGGPARKLLDVPLGFTWSLAFDADALYAVADSPHSLSDETFDYKVWRVPFDDGAPEVLADTEQWTDRLQLTKSGLLLSWSGSGSLLAVDTTTDQRPGPALPDASRVLAVSDDAVLSTSASSDDLSVTPLAEGKTKAVWPEAGALPVFVDRAWSDGEGGWIILAEEWFDDEKVRDTLWSVDTAGRAQRVNCQDPKTATDGAISSGVAGDGAFYALTSESRLIKILLPGQAP